MIISLRGGLCFRKDYLVVGYDMMLMLDDDVMVV